MNIVLCLKQLTQATDTEDSNAISPYDMYMLKQAVTYKKNHSDVTIICLTMGPVSSESMLRRALSLGCDEAIRITDVCYSGSDTIATSYVLSEAIKRIDQVGAILCGKKSLDGETGFVGPSIAGLLNIPYLIAFGVSGSIHHVCGITNSKKIIAVNRDCSAPIFEYSDVGIVADTGDVIRKIGKKILS